MFGVYFIGKTDDVWTLISIEETAELAQTLLSNYKKFVASRYGDVLDCMAISQGNDEKHVPRKELKSVLCESS